MDTLSNKEVKAVIRYKFNSKFKGIDHNKMYEFIRGKLGEPEIIRRESDFEYMKITDNKVLFFCILKQNRHIYSKV